MSSNNAGISVTQFAFVIKAIEQKNLRYFASKAMMAAKVDTETYNAAIEELKSLIEKCLKSGGNAASSILNAATLTEDNQNKVFNIEDDFTSNEYFLEGAGIDYPAGTNVAVVKDGDNFKFDALTGIENITQEQLQALIDSYLPGIDGDDEVPVDYEGWTAATEEDKQKVINAYNNAVN